MYLLWLRLLYAPEWEAVGPERVSTSYELFSMRMPESFVGYARGLASELAWRYVFGILGYREGVAYYSAEGAPVNGLLRWYIRYAFFPEKGGGLFGSLIHWGFGEGGISLQNDGLVMGNSLAVWVMWGLVSVVARGNAWRR